MFANPIGWVQLQILGGLRKQAIIVSVYTFFALTLLFLMYRGYAMDQRPNALQNFAAMALMPASMILLGIFFFGCAHSIKKAIQRDFTSNMITSHRNCAIGGATAVWGYLTGAPSQVLLLTMANFMICMGLAVLAAPAISPAVPAVMMIIFLCPAFMLFSLDILMALSTRGAMIVTPVFAVFSIFGALNLLDICPGLSLILTAVSKQQLAQGSSPDMVGERFVAMPSQLALGLTFFLAAARKFQRDDVPAFNETLAFCLLALATLIGVVGIGLYDPGQRIFGPDFVTARQTHLVATLVPLAWIAMISVAHSAGRATAWARRRRKDVEFAAKSHRPPRGFIETAIAATLVVFGIFAACYQWIIADQPGLLIWKGGVPTVVWIVLAFLLSLITAGGIFYTVYAAESKAGWAFVLLTIMTWLAPILVEFAYAQFTDRDRTGEWKFSPIFGCSPVGTWILTLFKLPGAVAPGIGFQVAIAAGAILLARRARP